MILELLEGVALVFIIGATLFTAIGTYWATTPDRDREAERRQMRDERRRPGRER